MINGHGNNIYHYASNAVEYDFSSNIAYNNHSQAILNHLRESLDLACNYPDPEARKLTQLIANHIKCDMSQLLITNGSAEAFYLTAQYFAAQGLRRAAILTPSFAEYEDSCKANKIQIDYISFDELNGLDLANYDTLWVGVPNNPNAKKIECSALIQLAKEHPRCTIIIDRAYNELSAKQERGWELLDNIIIIDSFTKLYGIPGIRLGYIVATQSITASLSALRPPWSVNALSLRAGEYIMRNLEALHPDIEELIGESKRLQSKISQIEGFRVTPSDCNFFLVEIEGGRDAAELQEYLLSQHKILIRNCSNFRGLTPRHFRLAAQSRVACDKLIKALSEWR